MPRRETPLYRRGKYWLNFDTDAAGNQLSKFLHIFWYDPDTRHVRRTSTGTADEDAAILKLDLQYLADRGEAPAFCFACGQPRAQADVYLLTDAIADYLIEWGDHQRSADSIQARLKHVVDFLKSEDARGAEGRFGTATSSATAAGNVFVAAFRAWSRLQPVEWRNKAGEVTASKPRAPATTEEAVTQLAAVLNHACKADPPRSDKPPVFKALPRKQVSRPRRSRVDIATIAQMLDYAATPGEKRGSLHAFIVASICTLARPDSVVDISVSDERMQWWPGSPTLDLNPHGRMQTKKFRPVVPVLPVLGEWLAAEHDRYRALDRKEQRGRGWLVNYYGRPIQDVDTAWNTMLTNLKLPTGREWKSYILRHSMATILRNRAVARWDLEGFMGHRPPSQTEVYAIGEFQTVTDALARVLDELDALAPGALHPARTRVAHGAPERGGIKMSG